MNIRRRLLVYILPVMVLSTLVLAFLVMDGFLDMRSRALSSGERIGELSLSRSDAAMQEQLREGLAHISRESAWQVDFLMGEVRESAEMLRREMEAIVGDPAAYPPREVMGPAHREREELSAYFTFAPGVERDAAFMEEAGRFANASDFLLRTAEHVGFLHSVYVASPAGFMLQADVYSELTYA